MQVVLFRSDTVKRTEKITLISLQIFCYLNNINKKGGYCIKSLSEGVALSVRSLLGYPTPRVEDFQKPDEK